MTFATDQSDDPSTLLLTSQRMLRLREAVFKQREERVRTAIEAADALEPPILIDSLPSFYDDIVHDNIAQSLPPEYARTHALGGNSMAHEHGGVRARLTHYDYHALISEYKLFRESIFDVLREHHIHLQPQEVHSINSSIDRGIKSSVHAFALVQAAIREQFLAAVTHDLRNPLQTATLAAELILRGNDPTKMKLLAAKIIENNDRMHRMINDLLDVMVFQGGSQIPLKITNFDISDVIKEVQLEAATTHNAQFEKTGPSVIGWWDQNALQRALENILGNAVKYGAPGKPIRIRIDLAHGRLNLSIHNEGPPIPPEEQETIFQIFRRAETAKKAKKEGWGIGLPYVRGVVESHGGSVTVDSTQARGTTFIVDMPIDSRPYLDAPAPGSEFARQIKQ